MKKEHHVLTEERTNDSFFSIFVINVSLVVDEHEALRSFKIVFRTPMRGTCQ